MFFHRKKVTSDDENHKSDKICFHHVCERDALCKSLSVSELEFDAVMNWQKAHDKAVHSNGELEHSHSGGIYEWRFLPTRLGVIGYCICSKCKTDGLNHGAEDNSFNPLAFRSYMSDMNGVFVFRDVHDSDDSSLQVLDE